jgi:hypothetical protein
MEIMEFVGVLKKGVRRRQENPSGILHLKLSH